MQSTLIDMLSRARMAELTRASNQRVKGRSSLRTILDARRARRRSPGG